MTHPGLTALQEIIRVPGSKPAGSDLNNHHIYSINAEVVTVSLRDTPSVYAALHTFRLFRFVCAVAVALALSLVASQRAEAQAVGHYVQGITGLENGSAPPPGFYLAYIPYLDLVNSIKGPNGNSVSADLNIVAHNLAFSTTTTKKLLGANYGAAIIIPIVNTRVTANIIDASAQNAGVSDIYLEPLILGWEKGRATYILNYGFYAPSGDYNTNNALNDGLGYWEHQIQLGSTVNFDKKKLWNGSVLSTWEINQSVLGKDLTPGPMASFEYSFGRRFWKYAANAGVAGFAYTKLSADSGSAVSPLFRGDRDRSFGLGPEFKYTSIKHKLGFSARYEPEFGARLRTSGNILSFSITFLNFFPPPHP